MGYPTAIDAGLYRSVEITVTFVRGVRVLGNAVVGTFEKQRAAR